MSVMAYMLNGRREKYPPAKKKLTVRIDIPEFLEELGMDKDATELVKEVSDLTSVAFYYLLRVGE